MANPLESLLVIDRLEVGPVRVEPRRLVAPYRVAPWIGTFPGHPSVELVRLQPT